MTTVGLLMSDQNSNGASELGASLMAPFLVGTDVFMDAQKRAWSSRGTEAGSRSPTGPPRRG